jgi:hypothetical protein
MPAAWSYSTAFVKVPRPIGDRLKRDPEAFVVYWELLARARYQAGPVPTSQGAKVDLAIGQAVYGRRELAAKLELTEDSVRNALERLERLEVITRDGTHRGTIVTMCGFSESTSTGQETAPTGDRAPTEPTENPPPNPPPTRREIPRRTPRRTREATGVLDLDFARAADASAPAETPAGTPADASWTPPPDASKTPTNKISEKKEEEERNTHSLQNTTARDRTTAQQNTSGRNRSPLPPEPLGIAETFCALVESTNPGAIKINTRTVRDCAIEFENLHRTGPSYADIAQTVAWLGTAHPNAHFRPQVFSGRDVRMKWPRLCAAQKRERSSTGRIDPQTANHDEDPAWMKGQAS